MKYKEPVNGHELELTLISREQLVPSRYQRDVSQGLVKRLVESVNHGFIMPLVVVPNGSLYDVIDGQHRLAALDKSVTEQPYKVPCIIVPSVLREMPLIYNIEKTDNIKDKATKVHRLYLDAVSEIPGDNETLLGRALLYEWYLCDIAFAYREYELKSPSLVDSVAKKFSKGFREPFENAVEIRREHGEKLAELEQIVNDRARDAGITEFFVKKSMISRCTMELWGRKRNLDVTFDEGIQLIFQKLYEKDWARWAGM